MTLATIRQRLITYLTQAEEGKIKAVYTLLKQDIERDQQLELTDEDYAILKYERDLHLAGESKSYKREEAMNIIRGQQEL